MQQTSTTFSNAFIPLLLIFKTEMWNKNFFRKNKDYNLWNSNREADRQVVILKGQKQVIQYGFTHLVIKTSVPSNIGLVLPKFINPIFALSSFLHLSFKSKKCFNFQGFVSFFHLFINFLEVWLIFTHLSIILLITLFQKRCKTD